MVVTSADSPIQQMGVLPAGPLPEKSQIVTWFPPLVAKKRLEELQDSPVILEEYPPHCSSCPVPRRHSRTVLSLQPAAIHTASGHKHQASRQREAAERRYGSANAVVVCTAAELQRTGKL